MKGPRCMKHMERHYMAADCDQCKKERIEYLEARLRDAEELLRKLEWLPEKAMDGSDQKFCQLCRANERNGHYARKSIRPRCDFVEYLEKYK